MKKTYIIILSTIFMPFAGHANADELSFPKTEQEIIEALSIKDDRTVFDGVEYISEKGIIGRHRDCY